MASKWHTEGVEFNGKVVFTKEATVPTNYYVLLIKDQSVGDTDGLSDLDECDAPGYARQALVAGTDDFTVESFGTNDRRVLTDYVTFSFTGAGDPVYMAALATTVDDSGKLIASGTLVGAPITPADQGTVQVRFSLPLTTP
jgi:hypothetical protein